MARKPWLLLVMMGALPGCVGQGALNVKDVQADYLAPPPRKVDTFDLTKLARPTEAQIRLQPGDFLEVTCANLYRETTRDSKETETLPVRVAADGTISLPLLRERLTVGSLTVGEAEQVMRNAYRGADLIQQPRLTLKLLEPRKSKIYVMGAVKKPGVYELRPDHCDPLRAIAAAEGLSEDAGTVIEIRRASKNASTQRKQVEPSDSVVQAGYSRKSPDPAAAAKAPKSAEDEHIVHFDLSDDIRVRPDQLQLHNGDIVSVEQKKKRPIFVTGSVNKAGEFPIPPGRDIRVLEAVGMAGGILNDSEPNHVLLTRRPEGKKPIVVHILLDRAARHPEENICLVEGDVINVTEDWASQTRRYLRQLLHLGVTPIIP